MQPLTLLLTMAMCHTIFAVPVAGKEIKKVKEPKVSGWKILKYTAVGGLLTVPTIAISTVIAAVCAKASKDSKKQKDAGHTQRQGSSPGYTSPLYTTDTSDISYTPNTSDSPYTHYTTDTSLYDSEEATNAAEKSYTDDEKSTKDRNTEQDELEIDNEIESEITAKTNVAEGNISPGTIIPFATSSQVGQSSDISSAAVESDKDVQYPIIATAAVKATSAPPSIEKIETTDPEHVHKPAIYIDENDQFQKLLKKVRDRPEKERYTGHRIDIEWEDIQDYTEEQIELLQQAALPRANVKNLCSIDLGTAMLKDAYGASFYEIPDFNEEAAYRIMKALMYAGSSLAFTSYNAESLKAMARAQRENIRDLEGVKVHTSLNRLSYHQAPVTRDVLLPDSYIYSLHTVPGTHLQPVIEWSVLKMDTQEESDLKYHVKPRFTLEMNHEKSEVEPDISYSLVRYPHPTELDQSVLKIQQKEVSLIGGEELLGECKASAYGRFDCTKTKV